MGVELEEARDVARDAEEHEAAVGLIGRSEAEAEAERVHVWERRNRADGDRREEWEDLLLEASRQRPELSRTTLGRSTDLDSGGRQCRPEVGRPQLVLR